MSPLVDDSLVTATGDRKLSAADKAGGVTPDSEAAVAVGSDPIVVLIGGHIAGDATDSESRGQIVHDDPVRILVEDLTFLLATGKEKEGGTHYRVKYLFHSLYLFKVIKLSPGRGILQGAVGLGDLVGRIREGQALVSPDLDRRLVVLIRANGVGGLGIHTVLVVAYPRV